MTMLMVLLWDGQVQGSVLAFSALCRVGAFGKVWAVTLAGITARKTIHEKIKIANQGVGLS